MTLANLRKIIMATGKSQFTGTAGQFYVAYVLSVREINAAITLGNAPSVDLMASSADGKRTVSIQVKTSRNAYRGNRYGHEGYEWDVNKGVIEKHHESFWYAFVDLQEGNSGWNPRIFFVPSIWVAKFVKPDWSRFMYFLPKTVEDITLEKWDILQGYLCGDAAAIKWANDWPKERLVKWGTSSE
jgi:hypothetical protein